MLFVTPAAFFETFGNHQANEISIILLIIALIGLGFIFFVFFMQIIASFDWLYSKDNTLISLKPLYLFYKDSKNDKHNPSYKERIIHTLLGFLLFLLFFANLYQLLSWGNKLSFNVSMLNFIDSFYFSTTTSATVGFGDICPKSHLAKVAVIFQILITFLYGIIILSSLPNILNKLNDQHE
jgi:hypothetical protein